MEDFRRFEEQQEVTPNAEEVAFDDLLNVSAVPYDDKKAAFVAESKRNREICYEMSEEMTQKVATDVTEFQRFLDTQSKFDRYTVNNVLLIMAQKPEATKLGDYGYWKNQGVYIEKGEINRPVLIMVPGKEYERDDGSIGTYYNAQKNYDISQTTLRRKIQPEQEVQIDDKKLIKALVYNPPVNIVTAELEQMPADKGADFAPEENCIYVKKGMKPQQIFRSVALELCHAELAKGDAGYDRRVNVFPAYCASYMLSKKYGMNVENYDFKYAPEVFEGMEPQEIRSELSKAKEVFSAISSRMAQILEPRRSENHRQPQQNRDEAR